MHVSPRPLPLIPAFLVLLALLLVFPLTPPGLIL
jgi:hypothetical protein